MTSAGHFLSSRRLLLTLLLLATVLLGWAYRDTFAAIMAKWQSDAAFSHGFLILPISLWLAWRKRAALAATSLQPSVLGVMAILLCTLAWMVARGSGVLVIEQFAAVAMIPALVLVSLGWHATRVLIVPLAFLFFMVPFGRGLVPALMQATADLATLLLQGTGVPVYRSHMYISIPSGDFTVARACSGLNYFTTSLVLGCLYAYVSYRGWLKRAACVAAFAVIPVILNGLRVYFTILVSHLTDMRFGPGAEHVMFGRIFFVVMMLVLFWFGRRWHDDMAIGSVEAGDGITREAASLAQWWPLPLACLLALAGPPFLASSIAGASEHLADRERLATLPAAASNWRGPLDGAGRWRPLYTGGLVERQAVYETPDGQPVDVFVAVYGLGATVGAEMISYHNVISSADRGYLARDKHRVMSLPDGTSLKVREVVAGENEARKLVWHWFVVGERPAVNPFAAKALEAMAFVTRSAYSERIVAIHTPLDAAAAQRLEAFIETYGRCVALGFPAEACGG